MGADDSTNGGRGSQQQHDAIKPGLSGRDARRATVHEKHGIERHELPGRIQAASYHSYFQANRGDRTAKPLSRAEGTDWLATDDWLGYDADVREAGQYDLTLTVAAADGYGGGSFQFAVDNDPVERMAFEPTGGWYSWTDVTTTVELPRGLHRLQVFVAEGGWKLDAIRLERGPRTDP